MKMYNTKYTMEKVKEKRNKQVMLTERMTVTKATPDTCAVSYTHLDVYKRQIHMRLLQDMTNVLFHIMCGAVFWLIIS